ncbi:S-layer homology domain-containing protein [Schinkia sp. CFF1]
MNKKLINVLSTSFIVMGLATGCGVATNDAGNDRNRNNVTPVGYDNRTNFTPLNVADTTPADDGVDITSPDPALNQNESADGDGTPAASDNDTDNAGAGTNNGTTNNGTTTGDTTTGNDTVGNNGTDTNDTTTPNTNGTTGGNDTNTDNDTTNNNEGTTGTNNNQTNTGDQTLTQTPTLGGNITPFSDVPKNSGYYNDIHDARKLGLLNGTDTNKNTFGYNHNVTREQIASILMKAYRAGYIAEKITTNDNDTNTTNDTNTNTNNNNTGTVGTDTNDNNNTGTTNNTTGTDTNGTDNTGTNAPDVNKTT